MGRPVANLDLRNRAPTVERLPDGRLRVTRVFDVLNFIPKDPAKLILDVWLSWGTADDEFTDCRLIKQDILGQPREFPDDSEKPPILTRVYEEISATAETLVGNPDITVNQYSYKEVTYHWIQFSANSPTHQVPGTTAAPSPYGTLLLRDEVATDDGTVRLIKRTYVEGGLLADYEELKFGGKLLIRTLKSLLEVPTTPTGFTLVTRSTEYVNGCEVYSYGYASAAAGAGAGGEIRRDVEYKISPDQGTTGVTVTTISHVTDLTIVANPITGPVGSELIQVTFEDDSGYRLWRAVYAEGQGLISETVDTKEGGKLVVYSRTSINAAPSAPSATIGGTVTLISQKTRNGTDAASGTVLYEYEWAEGIGEISRKTEYNQSSDAGTTGVTIVTVRALTALGAGNPVSSPGGAYALISAGSEEQDGYLLWTVAYATGTGTVTTDIELRNNGKLVLYRLVALGAAPSAPAPTIGGTVVSIGTSVRESEGYQIFDYRWAEGVGQISEDISYSQSDDQGTTGVTKTVIKYLVAPAATIQPTSVSGSTLIGQKADDGEGYRIWETTWAKGTGLVVDEYDIQVANALVTYRRVQLGSAPSAPAATIGGTVTLFENSVRKADGFDIYERRWSEGSGQSSIETRGEPDGALLYSVTTFTAAAATPAYPGSGTAYLISLEQTPSGAFFRNQAIYKKPPATQTRRQTIEWQKPGLASFTGTQLTLSPPATRTLLASIEVSYSTTQDTTTPWEVEAYASFVFSYVTSPLNAGGTRETDPTLIVTPSQTVSGQKGLGGYLSGATSVSGTNANYNGILCDSYSAVLVSSIPSSRPTGATVLRVENEPYLTATDGTVVYRITKVSYTF